MSPTRSIIQQLTKSPGLPKGGSGHYASPAQVVTSRLAEASWKTDRVAELCDALKVDGAKSVGVVVTGMDIGALWKAVCEVYDNARRMYYMPNSTTYFESKGFHAAVKGSNIVCVRAAGFIGDFAAFIVTDDSPEKVLRKLSAHVNGLAESQRINESTWIQGLADELVDDGAKAASVIRMPLAIYDLRKASQLAYPDAVKTYFIPGSLEYSVDHRFHHRSVGATIVVVQSEQHRDCAVFIITNDSPEKVVRKLVAAVAVEEHLQEETNQFQTWTGQPPILGIPGETLLGGLVDAGIKYGGFVLTGIVSREVVTALIRERAYPMDDIQRVLADNTFGYETHVSPLVKDKSRPVVVLGMTLDASMFVVVSTWDSPDKVARKLQAALSVRESKLTEGWQVMPHRPSLTELSTEEWYDLELRLKRNGIRRVGYVYVADYTALDVDYRRQLIEVYGQENVTEVSGRNWLLSPRHVGKGGIVVYSWVTAGSRILVVTDDSPEKLVRKMVAHGATNSELEESWTASPTVNLDSSAQHSELEAGVLLLKGLGATVTGYVKSDTCMLGDLMQRVTDEFGAAKVAVIPGYSNRRSAEFLARVRGKNVVITLSRANWPVAVVTDDSPEKVVRRLTRGETTQESMINEDRGGPLVLTREFPEESPMYRIVENMERHGTKVSGIISNFWGAKAYDAAIRAGYAASWSMSLKNSDGVLDINGHLVEQVVLVTGSLVTSSICVCVHTDDSPEKVLRKLEAARINTESLSRNIIEEATE